MATNSQDNSVPADKSSSNDANRQSGLVRPGSSAPGGTVQKPDAQATIKSAAPAPQQTEDTMVEQIMERKAAFGF